MGTVETAESQAGYSRAMLPVADGDLCLSNETDVTQFHCTGFGPFHGVTENPTEMLMRQMRKHLKRNGLPPKVAIASATVLEVSALSTRTLLERMHSKVTDSVLLPMGSFTSGARKLVDPQPRTVFLHFGVDTSLRRFGLELQGRNEATFSCPDEAGWSPIMRQIDPDVRIPLTHVRQTKLPIHRLASELRDDGFEVGVSSDAGRFVCNWVYYNSLRLSELNGSLALFVHVPSLEVVPIQAQLHFFSALVSRIASLQS